MNDLRPYLQWLDEKIWHHMEDYSKKGIPVFPNIFNLGCLGAYQMSYDLAQQIFGYSANDTKRLENPLFPDYEKLIVYLYNLHYQKYEEMTRRMPLVDEKVKTYEEIISEFLKEFPETALPAGAVFE